MGGKFETVIISDWSFEKLTEIVIIIYFGHDLPEEVSISIPQDF
ncbi:hypothetical protein [Clostridium sp. DL-VIII]|nr:hypothetical protein [Clostridium sp. DL-VIII]